MNSQSKEKKNPDQEQASWEQEGYHRKEKPNTEDKKGLLSQKEEQMKVEAKRRHKNDKFEGKKTRRRRKPRKEAMGITEKKKWQICETGMRQLEWYWYEKCGFDFLLLYKTHHEVKSPRS